jgi:hypothetical protein
VPFHTYRPPAAPRIHTLRRGGTRHEVHATPVKVWRWRRRRRRSVGGGWTCAYSGSTCRMCTRHAAALPTPYSHAIRVRGRVHKACGEGARRGHAARARGEDGAFRCHVHVMSAGGAMAARTHRVVAGDLLHEQAARRARTYGVGQLHVSFGSTLSLRGRTGVKGWRPIVAEGMKGGVPWAVMVGSRGGAPHAPPRRLRPSQHATRSPSGGRGGGGRVRASPR